MPRILLIETSTKTCSVGVSDGKELIAIKEITGESYKHSEVLHVYIDEMLNKENLSWDSFDAVCVSKGPGSYTGLRIGVSSAKGFCFGGDLKLLSLTSLESISQVARDQYPGYEYYIPMIDARRMEVFCQVFDASGKAKSEVEAKILDSQSFEVLLSNHSCLFIGDGANKFKEVLQNANGFFEEVLPSVRGMIQSADQKFATGQFEDVAYFEPFYLKNFVAGK